MDPCSCLRRSLITMRLTSFAAVSAAVLAVTVPASSEAQSARPLPPPGVSPNASWVSESSGPTDPSKSIPQLFVVTRGAPRQPRPHLPLSIFGGLRQLAPNAALIWASTTSRGHFDHFPYDAWPPRLAHFRVDHGWEGQPAARIQQRLLWFTSHGWSLDVRVYFGTQHPSTALIMTVQSELNRLTLPKG